MNGLAFVVWALIPLLLIIGELRFQYIARRSPAPPVMRARTAHQQAAMSRYRKTLLDEAAHAAQPSRRFTPLLELMDGNGINPLRVLAGVVLGGVGVGLLFALWVGLLGLFQ